jgi:hypothetical protein
VAVRRGAPLIAVGSGLSVLGTLLYLLPEAQQARREMGGDGGRRRDADHLTGGAAACAYRPGRPIE